MSKHTPWSFTFSATVVVFSILFFGVLVVQPNKASSVSDTPDISKIIWVLQTGNGIATPACASAEPTDTEPGSVDTNPLGTVDESFLSDIHVVETENGVFVEVGLDWSDDMWHEVSRKTNGASQESTLGGEGGENGSSPPPPPPPPPPPLPSVNITVNNSNGPITIAYNTAALLEWCGSSASECANATSCSVPGIGSGTSGSFSTGALTSGKTYTLTCTGPGGTATNSVRVNVLPPPPPTFTADGSSSGITIIEGDSVTLAWACVDSVSSWGVNFSTGGAVSGSTSVTPPDTTTYITYTVLCSNGGQRSLTVTVLHPSLSITATPSLLQPGNVSEISWTATSVNSCSVSENSVSITDSWSGTSGAQTSSGIVEETIYTLTCLTDAGAVSESVTVNLVPTFEEF